MTWYRVGPAGIPGSLKTDMDAVLNKKFGTSTTYAPNTWPDNVNLLGPLPEKTASGAIASITDGADGVPLKNWLVTLPASLDGYSSLTCKQKNANFAELSNDDNPNKNAFTYTTLTPAKIEWEKTLSGGRFIVRFVVHIPKAGSYTFSEKNNTGGLYIYSDELWGTAVASNKATPYTHTFASAGTYVIGIYNGGAIGTTGTLENIMCEWGNSASGTFEAYEAPTTYTASLGRTIYGGTADIVTGEGEDGFGKVTDFSALTANGTSSTGAYRYRLNITNCGGGTYGDAVSNVLTYRRAFNANANEFYNNDGYLLIYLSQDNVSDAIAYLHNNNVEIVYPYETATDFTFTPITPTPETALGVNNFWADEGDTEVTYRADISLALQALGGGGRGLMGMMMQRQEEEQLTEEDPEEQPEEAETNER